MSVVINGRFFLRRTTGVERYGTEIVKRCDDNVRVIRPARPLHGISGHAWEQLALPQHLGTSEVLWSPANSGPWTVRRQAVTIHDASPFDHPEWFKPAFGAWTRLSWRILAKTARSILTVSNFSSERLKKHLSIPESKLHVVYDGVGRPFKPQSQKALSEIREKYGLKKPYFLFVGTQEPRKNLKTLFQAWDSFLLSNTDYSLVIAGQKGTVFSAHGAGKVLNLTYVQFLDYVPDDDLPALYSGAFATLVPSLYEGFGLTALEAMACGTPVIASNTTSFPEVVGNSALSVDPANANEIANAMLQISDNPALANTLSEGGIQHASQFTWDESARKIQSLLESL
jgi:glycosyltransferase involved in cell wall biosynthesis